MSIESPLRLPRTGVSDLAVPTDQDQFRHPVHAVRLPDVALSAKRRSAHKELFAAKASHYQQ
jgi:hypothetical protein